MNNRHEPYGIELRSKTIQDIMCHIPHNIVIWGWIVIVAIAIALILCATMIHFPYLDGKSIIEHWLS